MHQRPALIDDTVEAALQHPFRLGVHRGKNFNRDRAVALLGELGRDAGFLEKHVGDLSGGEQQITALVRAVQLDPQVLLLDEPTSALDPPTAQAVERLLVEWAATAPDQRALVWVSHDAAQARRIGDRRMLMESGRLLDAAAPAMAEPGTPNPEP